MPTKKTRWVRARLFTVFNEVTGEPQYHCGVLTDISEQRRQLTILREAKNQSEELNRIKSNILSNIRHEFRTPLTGIKGFADLIQMGTDDDELHEYSKSITISANRLQNTLDSLLDFSVVDAGFVKANPSWISVEETIFRPDQNAGEQSPQKRAALLAELFGQRPQGLHG